MVGARLICALFLGMMVPASLSAQWQMLPSESKESLRGLAVSGNVVWATGTHGTYVLSRDNGATWKAAQVPGAETLDFRGAVAFGSSAFLMSSGSGELSRIYHTSNLGKDWKVLYTNRDPKGFFDSMAFADERHGLVVGDPVNGRFEILRTDDAGATWNAEVRTMPPAIDGEGAFAASNSCIVMRGAKDIWFITGGTVARVFRSRDGGDTWTVSTTPLVQGKASTGGFSIAMRDNLHGRIAGGDYQHPERGDANLASTSDGGVTWTLVSISPMKFFTAIAYGPNWIALAGSSASAFSPDGLHSWSCFSTDGFNALALGDEFVYAAGADGRIAKAKLTGTAPCSTK